MYVRIRVHVYLCMFMYLHVCMYVYTTSGNIVFHYWHYRFMEMLSKKSSAEIEYLMGEIKVGVHKDVVREIGIMHVCMYGYVWICMDMYMCMYVCVYL